jgi:hypothetical protein
MKMKRNDQIKKICDIIYNGDDVSAWRKAEQVMEFIEDIAGVSSLRRGEPVKTFLESISDELLEKEMQNRIINTRAYKEHGDIEDWIYDIGEDPWGNNSKK